MNSADLQEEKWNPMAYLKFLEYILNFKRNTGKVKTHPKGGLKDH